MAAPDMEVIKDIPGYKVILKAILKTQIQMLVEQLATHTDEESVILTASVADGTLSHLGSDSGKSFLDDNEDVKSQFLGFCLKRHHKRKLEEKQREEQEALQAALSVQPRLGLGPSPRRVMRGGYRMATPRHPGLSPGAQMPTPGIRHEPYPVTRPQRSNSLSSLDSSAMNLSSGMNASGMPVIKTEPSDSESNPQNAQDKDNNTSQPQTNNEDSSSNSAFQNEQSNTAHASDSDSGMDPNVSVKLEAMNEDDLELEITGVEPGQIPSVADMQMQNMSMDQSFLTGGAAGSQADVMGQGFMVPQGFTKALNGTSGGVTCEVCGKVVTCTWNLTLHMRTHTGYKPYKCDKCGRSFTQKSNLNSHMVVHLKL